MGLTIAAQIGMCRLLVKRRATLSSSYFRMMALLPSLSMKALRRNGPIWSEFGRTVIGRTSVVLI